MPSNREVAAACHELDRRRAAGESVPILDRVVCHDQVIAKAWELEPGRALLRADRTSEKTTIVGGGKPARDGPRRPVTEAILVDGEPGPFERAHRAPTRCPRGHHVILARSEVQEAVALARQRGRKVTIRLAISPTTTTAVLHSIS
jgi:hypothetical protein